MENQAPLSPSAPEHDRPAARKARPMAAPRGLRPSGSTSVTDWQSGSGIVDQMLAYSDWWNIPAGRAQSAGRNPRPERG
jgi:hypothetical protein